MKISQVAAQLYTLRDHAKTPADLAQTLGKVAQIGYQSVQVSGICAIEPSELVQMCGDNGLSICATHEPATQIIEEPQKVADHLLALGCQITAYPHPAGVDLSSLSSVDQLIEGLDKSGAVLRENGLQLLYHNHSMEFRKLGGQTIWDRIFANTDPRNVGAEPDTYWVQHGGASPVTVVEKLAGRMPAIHLKDFAVSDQNQPMYCEIGNGNLDFPAIIAAAEKGGCQWFIVEQDTTPGDPFDSLRQSFEYIQANLVA